MNASCALLSGMGVVLYDVVFSGVALHCGVLSCVVLCCGCCSALCSAVATYKTMPLTKSTLCIQIKAICSHVMLVCESAKRGH